jgi:hypothetical protein
MGGMRKKILKVFLVLVLCLQSVNAFGTDWADIQSFLIKKISPRSSFAMSGSEFAKSLSAMDRFGREQALVNQFIKGNLPDFLRRLKPVRLVQEVGERRTVTATIFVMPDYLAIGSDRDFLLMPMGWYAATAIAVKLGFILPTKKMVDAIFEQSDVHLSPAPMPPGPQMRSLAYFSEHNRKIKEQRLSLGCPLGALISGHKKDVVLTNRLGETLGRVAIYGWHRLSGIPVQPLTIVHGANYADYSHGIRLVSDVVLIDGEPRSIYEVLEDPKLATIVSDEGPIQKILQFMGIRHSYPNQPAPISF